MVMNKRAQFFLLIAVIISAVVISLGVISNRATVNREPENFYDFSYEVSREVGAVIDYEVYSEFDSDADLDNFVDLLAEDIRDKDKDLDFMFIFGDEESMTLMNYGSTDVLADGEVVSGAGSIASSKICFGGSCKNVNSIVNKYKSDIGRKKFTEEEMEGSDSIDVEIEDSFLSFPISRHRQVIFIIQKEVGDESFVAVE